MENKKSKSTSAKRIVAVAGTLVAVVAIQGILFALFFKPEWLERVLINVGILLLGIVACGILTFFGSIIGWLKGYREGLNEHKRHTKALKRKVTELQAKVAVLEEQLASLTAGDGDDEDEDEDDDEEEES